jgi:hypothetical protein
MSSLYDKLMEKTIRETQRSPAVNPASQAGKPNQEPPPPPVKAEEEGKEKHKENTVEDTAASRYHETMIPRDHDTMHDTMVSRHHETTISSVDETVVEEVRKAVRQFGKEPATQRLTTEEKEAISAIEYRYKRQGIKTSGNEIIRIALNYILREYREQGEKSILAQVISKLNS